MTYLIARNLRVYFRDRLAVFFSFLSALIIILVYALFLGNVFTDPRFPGVEALMASWLVSGVLTTVTITTTLGALGTMVDDRVLRIDMDFVSSPVPRRAIAGAYVVSAVLVGMLMSLCTAILGFGYIALRGGALPTPETVLRVLGLIVLSTATSTAMLACLAAVLKTNNAFGTASTLIGTLIGFLAGIYLPVGQLPQLVRDAMVFLPPAHAASLFRQTIMEGTLSSSFEGAPAELLTGFREEMGVDLYFAGQRLSSAQQILILLAATLLFFGLAVILMRRKQR